MSLIKLENISKYYKSGEGVSVRDAKRSHLNLILVNLLQSQGNQEVVNLHF